MFLDSGKRFGFWDVFLDSGTCFWILRRVFGFWEGFWILGRVFGFWNVFLDSETCFWILGSVLDSGTCFWILGRVFGFWDVFLDSGKCFVPTSYRNFYLLRLITILFDPTLTYTDRSRFLQWFFKP